MTIKERLNNMTWHYEHSQYLWKGAYGTVVEVLKEAIRFHRSKKWIYKRLVKIAGPKFAGEPACIHVIRHEAEDIRKELKLNKKQQEIEF